MIPETIQSLPCWHGLHAATPLSGGLSNEIWRVDDANGAHVVRLGVDYPFHHVNRAREAMSARAAHAAGFGPAIHYTAPGVMVTAFINSRTWTAQDVAENPARVAQLLRRFHDQMPAHVSGEASLFWVFHVIRDYARTLQTSRHAAALPRYLALSAMMESAQISLPIIFGHNDLLPANFLDDGARLWLIDYEYAGFSTALFDLAGAASNAEMTPAQASVLLETYFGQPTSPALLQAFEAMKCAALLRETMWAMVSDVYLSAPGADYTAYMSETQTRLEAQLAAYAALYGKTLP